MTEGHAGSRYAGRRKYPSSRLTGFTLIEMSIVIAIVSIVVAATLSMGNSTLESVERVSTNNKLDEIEAALMAYRLANNRLPCPADPTITDIPAHAATYGYEAGTPGTCGNANTTSYTTAVLPANTNIESSPLGTPLVVEGAVPVRALGLSDEFQVDAWGRKFAYAVSTTLTTKGTGTNNGAAFLQYGILPSCGAISVENAAHGYQSTSAAYSLLSYGPDGHGGYTKGGSRYNAGSTMTNVDEIANSHFSNTGVDTGLYAGTYVQKDYNEYTGDSDSIHPFGHIIRYKERWQMQNAYDTYHPNGISCWPGFIVQGSPGMYLGYSVAVGDINGDGIPDLVLTAADGNGTASCAVAVIFGTRTGFPNPLPVSTLNGTNGFLMTGGTCNRDTTSVAVADINGDGYDDIIVGGVNLAAPEFFVLYGGRGMQTTNPLTNNIAPWPATISFSSLNGANGFKFTLPVNVNSAQNSIALTTGDFNGDGYADIVIGAPNFGAAFATGTVGGNNAPSPNQNFVLNGVTWTFVSSAAGCQLGLYTNCYLLNETVIQLNPLSGLSDAGLTAKQLATDLTNCNSAACPNFNYLNPGYTYVKSGNGSVTITSTVAGPGTAGPPPTNDFYTLSAGTWAINLATASGPTLTGGYGSMATLNEGAAYVIYGAKDASPGVHMMKDGVHSWAASQPISSGVAPLDHINGLEFDGITAGAQAGFSIAMGDINNDGFSDLVIGAPETGVGVGSVYVVFGGPTMKDNTAWSSSQQLNATLLNGTNGFQLNGGAGNGWGSFVATGDINGDGIADIVASTVTYWTYTAVVYGSGGTWANTPYTLSSSGILNGRNGFYLTPLGGTTYLGPGQHLSVADVNGDGYADIVSGNYYQNIFYLVFGKANWQATTYFNAAWFNGVNGVAFTTTDDILANITSTVGDINGDGIADIIFGNYIAAQNGSNSGAAYIYFGHPNSTPWPTSPFNLNGM